jgi:hypothetical protein
MPQHPEAVGFVSSRLASNCPQDSWNMSLCGSGGAIAPANRNPHQDIASIAVRGTRIRLAGGPDGG